MKVLLAVFLMVTVASTLPVPYTVFTDEIDLSPVKTVGDYVVSAAQPVVVVLDNDHTEEHVHDIHDDEDHDVPRPVVIPVQPVVVVLDNEHKEDHVHDIDHDDDLDVLLVRPEQPVVVVLDKDHNEENVHDIDHDDDHDVDEDENHGDEEPISGVFPIF